MRLKGVLLPVLTAVFLCIPVFGAQNSGSSTVWKIGAFDRSSGEFSGGSPKQALTYTIGQSTAKANWFGYQPIANSKNAGADVAAAPRTVLFNVNGRPAGAYRLHAAFLIEHSDVPAIRVNINGHQGRFYLHPRLDYSMGDTMAAFFPMYSDASVQFDFPGTYLHAGENRISFAVEGLSPQSVPDAGINYDAIELDRLEQKLNLRSVTARIDPTIFYKQTGSGLAEMVDVFVRYGEKPARGSVDLDLAGHRYDEPLRGQQDFGEERLEVSVPAFSGVSNATAVINLNGHRQTFHQQITAQKQWTLYLVPHVHLDVGYTDYQAKVAAIQSRIIDEAMDLTAKHPDFRFSIDGEWNLEQFMKTRTPEERQRVLQAIQKRQLYVPAQYANLLTGFPTTETMIRSLYPSADFSRQHGTPFDYANITDVPSYSWSYASVLAAAGIKYFAAASNNDRAPVLLQGHLNEKTPFWWEGPDGGKVLMWYSRTYLQMQLLFGLPPQVPVGRETIPVFLQMYDHASYRAHAAMIFGTQVENTDLYPQQAELVQEWNSSYAYPRMVYSGFHDALSAIAQQFGSDVPVVRGDGGPYWEDGIGSDAKYAAMERVNESRAPSAEKLVTISSLVNPRIAADKNALTGMWNNMVLMDEHTWLSYNSVSDPTSEEATDQLAVKDSRATTAHALVDHLMRSSMATLADSIAANKGNLVVFNTLNWKRSGLVTYDLPNHFQLVDRSTGQAVPVEVIAPGPNFKRVHFVATDVPAVGYKVYTLKPGPESGSNQTVSTTKLESPYYRVELDPESGAVRSIYDKQLGKELVNTASPYRFGQYLYVTGGDKEPNSILQYRVISPVPKLTVHGSGQGRVVSVYSTPYGTVAHLVSSDVDTPQIDTEIRVFNHKKKIEFVETIHKKSELKKEAVYFAFPFAMDHPEFSYEIQNGVVDPAKDMYPGAGREWFSVQHWVSAQQDGMSATVMPLDTPLVTLGDINRGEWPTTFGQRSGTVFSYALNNYWHTNYRAAQGGEFRFRYVVTSAPTTDAVALSHMGWEVATPLERDEITSQDKALDLVARPLDGKQGSFLTVNDPDLLVETWKPAEDGHGTILRLLDLGGSMRTATIETPLLDLQKVTETDAVERNQKDLSLQGAHSFQIEVRPHEIITIRVQGTEILKAPVI